MADQQHLFIRGLQNLRGRRLGCVATIGSYDGVHLGHQAIIRQVCAKAGELGVISVAVIFEPHPPEYFSGEQAPARLMTFREKLLALYGAGLDAVCCLRFDKHLSELTPRQFVSEVLVGGLGVRYLVVGDDFRFGRRRSGDFQFLREAGLRCGYEVSDTDTFKLDGERVSSTRTREALETGDFELAERLLGKPYSISGPIVYGQQLGRRWGVPTANVNLRRYRSPLQGVFAVRARLADGRSLAGVANVGVRPTIGDRIKPILEVHLLDFDENIYGQRMVVQFITKLREERKFSSLEELQAQIVADVDTARKFFA